MLVPTAKSKDALKMYKELRNKIRDLIRSIANNTHNCNEKHI